MDTKWLDLRLAGLSNPMWIPTLELERGDKSFVPQAFEEGERRSALPKTPPQTHRQPWKGRER